MKKIIIILLFCLSNILFAEVINIPSDFSTIQSGIEAAQTGDTILVQPGSYIENIDFKGKNVMVASLFIISNDPEDIKQTIIDGDQRGSVVTIDKGESSTAILCGFTITGGLTWNGGGINCSQSRPVLKNLLIKNNEANGLGGGINLYHANASLINVKIIENTAHRYGGGINCFFSNPYLESVSITQNKSYESGGGILFLNCSPVFSNENRCNIYFNTAVTGSDLCVELETPVISVVLDTFTVLNPTSFYVEPFDNFNFDILNSKIEQSNADLYVSPTGNNNNNGLSPDQPLQTIGVALTKIIADSSNPHTIYLADGIYTPTNTGEHFPLKMVSFVSIYGQSHDGTIIDAENQSNVLVFNQVYGSELKDLTITSGYASMDMQSLPSGGGIYCEESNPVFENILIHDNNTSGYGGGIFFKDSNPTLINTVVKENKALGDGGGIYFRGTHGSFENCLIKENKTDLNGGGIMLDSGTAGTTTKAVLQNTTITDNSALERGGGIFLHENDISVFDSLNRCNIFLNHASSGADLYCWFNDDENPLIPVYVDTFSVSQPSDFFAAPLEGFSFNILNSKFEQTDDDLYVNPNGDNNNSGLTSDEPLRTISFALSKIVSTKLKPNTIYLADGIYSPSNNGEIYPLTMTKNISIVGESQSDVVLDAESLTNIMVFDRDSSISIDKITITGGGNVRQGGGIYSINSEFNLSDITFRNNRARYGGGIYIVNSNVNMEYVTIHNNSAVNYGGGISIWYSGGIFKNVDVFSNNVENWGAGIDVTGPCEPFFSNINIYNNHALKEGGGLSLNGASPVFDNEQRCSIYLNNAPVGSDISLTGTSIDAILDTFTVITPTNHYASPLDSVTFDILNAAIQPIDSNLYVNPAGDNSNSGLSKKQPLKTISHALDMISADSLNPKTIFIESGIYSPSTNGEVFPLGMRNYVSLNGSSVDEVILNAENKSTVFNIVNKKKVTLENLTITNGFSDDSDGGIFCQNSNPLLKSVKILNNSSTHGSGGIGFFGSSPVLENVEINGNKTSYGNGGALTLDNSDARLTNVAIYKNTAHWDGGGIICMNSNPVLINSTISENTAGYQGGGIYCSQSNPVLINTIFWNNWPDEVYFEDSQNSNLITYSNIRSGKFGITTNNNGNVNWAEGNLSEQPLFVNPDSGNYNLQKNSPLINKGIAFLVWKGDTIVNIPEDAYFGNAPDIGAFETTFVTKIIPDPEVPAIFSLRQNYPNPFNPITTIEYQLAKSGLVKIEIFDILGRRVKVLTNGYRIKGYHRIKFDAGDLSSGIYFYKIISGKFLDVKKMVLIK